MITVYKIIQQNPLSFVPTDTEILLSGEEKVKLEVERKFVIGEKTYAPIFQYLPGGNKVTHGVYEVGANDK